MDTAEAIAYLALFAISVILTGMSLWAAGRLTPWFMREAIEPPSVRSFFFEPFADTNMTRVRLVMSGLALAIVLASMLAFAVTARMMGWHAA